MADIKIPKITFTDINSLEERARRQIDIDIKFLEDRNKKRHLNEADTEELDRLTALQALIVPNGKGRYFDPLFAATRAAFADKDSELRPITLEHTQGLLAVEDATPVPKGAKAKRAAPRPAGFVSDAHVVRAAFVLGLLQSQHVPLPRLVVIKNEVVPDPDDRNTALFAEAFYRAIGRAAGNLDLAMRVLRVLADAVEIAGDRRAPQVSALEFATVAEKLIKQEISYNDGNLVRYVEESLDRVQDNGDDKPEHEIGINLPDLELTTDNDVVVDNIRLVGPMIFASMFDELKAFQVVDKLVEMSQRGELALIKGKAGTRLYNYWRQAPTRMSETERQTFYAITLGLPTGPPGVNVNRDFPDLWIRFVSSVTSLVRESRVDRLIRESLPYAINQQQVKKAARDLTANMSLYGYGMAYYAAVDLQKQINEMIELLQDEELKKAFGARDMWGVIDHVAATELGGARSGSKYRMLAMSGNIITRWLASNLHRVKDATRPMIILRDVEDEPSRARGQTASSHPTDYDLVNACEMWLADSAMGEDRVEQMSQPRESPQQPSRPIQIPSFARDLLAGAGLGMEMSAQGRGRSGRPAPRGNGHYQGY